MKPELEAESGNEKYFLRKLQFRAVFLAKRKKPIKPIQNEMTIF
jgi:hypothetical protein